MKDNFAVGAAVVFLFLFGVGVVYMVLHTGDAETVWTRNVYIFGGVEAIAFAGGGYLFGREVHRVRAENAESRVKTAEEQATKGRRLAEEVRIKAEAHAHAAPGLSEPQMVAAATGTRAALDYLRHKANELFPLA